MIIGAHIMIQSTNGKADQAFLTEMLNLSSVDAGDGFMIFGVPPAEIAVHPGEANDEHTLFLMCDDVEAFVSDMKARSVACSAPANRGWGTLTEVTLPGGGRLGVYQPHHARPKTAGAMPAAAKSRKKAVRKTARKAVAGRKAIKKTARKPVAKKKTVKRGKRR